jgi:hypothetical protein
MRRQPVILALLLLAAPFVAAKPNPETEKVWVSMQPVDCLGNPWEKNWLAHHNNQTNKYPRAQELQIMKGFFYKKGVTILDYRTKPYVKGDPLCKTCGCPRGDTLLLAVHGAEVPIMRTFGFTDPVADEDLDKKPAKHAHP